MSLSAERIAEVIARLGKARVLILGDIMLDEYLFGRVDRISPEAPVPVVEISHDKLLLGGAANVAANIRALGDEPLLVGVVGEDEAAVKLSQLLKQHGIGADYCVCDRSRQTTIKTRIMAHSQQVVRADRENRHELHPDVERMVLAKFTAAAESVNAVIISDYGKGVITLSLLNSVMEVCRKRGLFVAVDPKETHFHNYKRVSLITPNHHEAGFAAGRRIVSEADLIDVGNSLLRELEARSILITRGPDGMSLFEQDAEPTHIPTFARKVFDVTGAGDTVIAAFVAAVCAGATLVEAAIVANAGAGITVGEVGTATVSSAELYAELLRNVKNGTLVTRGSTGTQA
ncbi:MAG TPA: D-glycero-beta-D-manno-heptose-7-phosphate kinase [candidate division Zixibacteria bacterium]|nr:D-glycero-beta-D-manno-heptose-7-phosphate kinase [candidate division Zixibacteria bacterium]MDD4916939.1 D-glycero-beta-D-manno-heptose-7-phosphate kinase [candidate division Zixibacteria bacterium]MDM7973062.1 D-glycero-beta-D-manno-heptose-7-phosphate kinase [candidate division Zixibacteria bacterium]HOD66820.1 D-glycero-beta-D-manno-heptose-7-phosphate kinase [candidate division Zixibacteria bacterium]HPI32199.1 D-glycero-beta-D-manno-heptose-7-phosphate kinase [candidate division Zixiba